MAVTALPATAQLVFSISPDTTIEVGTSNLSAPDHAVVVDSPSGIVTLEDLGPLPPSVEVVGYAQDPLGDLLFSLDTTTELPGSILAHRGDIVRFDGVNYSIEFEAIANGIPRSAQVDAISVSATSLFFSFDTTVELPGSLVVEDEDLVSWSGLSFSLAFDGSSAGLPRSVDLDAAHYVGANHFVVSLDTSESVAGLPFADEDLLEYDNGVWSMFAAGADLDSRWRPTDLDAVLFVPEPAGGIAVVAGLAAMAMFGRGLRRVTRGLPHPE